MCAKEKSVITKITVNNATFSQTVIEPSFVNIFYGKNGTGKSTIARSIAGQSGTELSSDPKLKLDDIRIEVFDTKYVRDNFSEHEDDNQLSGVFTLGRDNIQLNKQIKDTQEQISEINHEIDELREKFNEYEGAEGKKVKLKEKYAQGEIAALVNTYSRFNVFTGMKKDPVKLLEKLLATKPSNEDIDILDRDWNICKKQDAVRYTPLSLISDLETPSQILTKPIVSISTSEFSKLINETLHNLNWIKQGHDIYEHAANGLCPYCQQQLPQDFAEQISSCFDEQYKADIEKLKRFKDAYLDPSRALYQFLAHTLPSQIPKEFLTTDIQEKISDLIKLLTANGQALNEKIANPEIKINFVDTKNAIDDLNLLIEDINHKIQEHNEVFDNKNKLGREISSRVFAYLAGVVSDRINEYNHDVDKLNTEQVEIRESIKTKETEAKKLGRKLIDLKSQQVNVDATMNAMNRYLQASGLEGFRFEKAPSNEFAYVIRRNNNVIAHNLSEGERNFIAFLYFYHQVKGMQTATDSVQKRLVVIDDPATSMDSGVMFMIASLVNELMQNCINFYRVEPQHVSEAYIAQLFIFTHNDAFYRLITGRVLHEFACVSVFLVTKRNNQSKVKACIREVEGARTNDENYSPVKSTYATLWTEYVEVDSPMTLLHIMRQILEFYFIQILGYTDVSLEELIVKKRDEQASVLNEDGQPELVDWNTINVLLLGLKAASIPQFDGVSITEDATDLDLLKNAFRQFFILAGQGQHYEKMSEI